jgi:hypothetical protein
MLGATLVFDRKALTGGIEIQNLPGQRSMAKK